MRYNQLNNPPNSTINNNPRNNLYKFQTKNIIMQPVDNFDVSKEIENWVQQNSNPDIKIESHHENRIILLITYGKDCHKIEITYPKAYPRVKKGFTCREIHSQNIHTPLTFISKVDEKFEDKILSIERVLKYLVNTFNAYKNSKKNNNITEILEPCLDNSKNSDDPFPISEAHVIFKSNNDMDTDSWSDDVKRDFISSNENDNAEMINLELNENIFETNSQLFAGRSVSPYMLKTRSFLDPIHNSNYIATNIKDDIDTINKILGPKLSQNNTKMVHSNDTLLLQNEVLVQLDKLVVQNSEETVNSVVSSIVANNKETLNSVASSIVANNEEALNFVASNTLVNNKETENYVDNTLVQNEDTLNYVDNTLVQNEETLNSVDILINNEEISNFIGENILVQNDKADTISSENNFVGGKIIVIDMETMNNEQLITNKELKNENMFTGLQIPNRESDIPFEEDGQILCVTSSQSLPSAGTNNFLLNTEITKKENQSSYTNLTDKDFDEFVNNQIKIMKKKHNNIDEDEMMDRIQLEWGKILKLKDDMVVIDKKLSNNYNSDNETLDASEILTDSDHESFESDKPPNIPIDKAKRESKDLSPDQVKEPIPVKDSSDNASSNESFSEDKNIISVTYSPDNESICSPINKTFTGKAKKYERPTISFHPNDWIAFTVYETPLQSQDTEVKKSNKTLTNSCDHDALPSDNDKVKSLSYKCDMVVKKGKKTIAKKLTEKDKKSKKTLTKNYNTQLKIDSRSDEDEPPSDEDEPSCDNIPCSDKYKPTFPSVESAVPSQQNPISVEWGAPKIKKMVKIAKKHDSKSQPEVDKSKNSKIVDEINFLDVDDNMGLYLDLSKFTKNDKFPFDIKKLYDIARSLQEEMEFGNSLKVDKFFSSGSAIHVVMNEFKRLYYYGQRNNFTIIPLNDNIYHLQIKFEKEFFDKSSLIYSDLKNLDKEVVITVEIDSKLYPFYPPKLKMISPRLKNNINSLISTMKCLLLDYWDPMCNLEIIITNFKNLMNQYAEIDTNNTSYNDLENELINLSLLSGIPSRNNSLLTLDELINIKKQNTDIGSKKNSKKNNKKGFTNGVGYGYTGLSVWDFRSTKNAIDKRDKQLFCCIKNITKYITKIITNNINVDPVDIISSSCYIPYLKSIIYKNSMVELLKNIDYFEAILNSLRVMDKRFIPIFLIKDNENDPSLYEIFAELSDECHIYLKTIKKKVTKNDDESEINNIRNYVSFFSKIDRQIKEIELETNNSKKKEKIIEYKKTMAEIYKSKLKKLHCEVYDDMNKSAFDNIIRNSKDNKKSTFVDGKVSRQIIKEILSHRKSLPLELESSIFYRYCSSDLRYHEFIISGPEGTPYDSGCFHFRMYCTSLYPTTSPKVNIYTTGGGTVRFNPNLYECGKVCLSILGTWSAQASECWIPGESTMLQIMISIQSLVLNDKPYFNEPGYEREHNTPDGDIASMEYNYNIRYQCMKWAMIDMIRNPAHGFESVIKKHFKIKSEYIKTICLQWVIDAPEEAVDKYIKVYLELCRELDKLNKLKTNEKIIKAKIISDRNEEKNQKKLSKISKRRK